MADSLPPQPPQCNDRQFAVIPKETLHVYAESIGAPHLPDEVAGLLAEDASYRVRDVIQVSSRF